MVFVAGNQEDGAHVAIGKKAVARNLSAIIDIEGVCDGHVRAGRNQCVQVRDGSAVFPEEAVQIDVSSIKIKRSAHDLTSRINAFPFAAGITPNRLEISHYSVLPKKRMEELVTYSVGNADDLSGIVNPVCVSECSSQCAEVFHAFVLSQKKGVLSHISRQVRGADDFAMVVKITEREAKKRTREGASESAEVRHLAVLP